MCYFFEELFVIVKECFFILIFIYFLLINWVDFGFIYIFDKSVFGEWVGFVKKFLYIDICLN